MGGQHYSGTGENVRRRERVRIVVKAETRRRAGEPIEAREGVEEIADGGTGGVARQR